MVMVKRKVSNNITKKMKAILC